MRKHQLLLISILAGSASSEETSSAEAKEEGGGAWLSWAKWDEMYVTLSGKLQSQLAAYDQFFGEERVEE